MRRIKLAPVSVRIHLAQLHYYRSLAGGVGYNALVTVTYTDTHSISHTTELLVTASTFPLTKGLFDPSIWEKGTFDRVGIGIGDRHKRIAVATCIQSSGIADIDSIVR